MNRPIVERWNYLRNIRSDLNIDCAAHTLSLFLVYSHVNEYSGNMQFERIYELNFHI
jgi:hypothetical protein